MTMSTGIIKPFYTSWWFPVAIATKKGGKPTSCVDNWLLNQRTKPSHCPNPHVEEIFDEVKEVAFSPRRNSSTDTGKLRWQRITRSIPPFPFGMAHYTSQLCHSALSTRPRPSRIVWTVSTVTSVTPECPHHWSAPQWGADQRFR